MDDGAHLFDLVFENTEGRWVGDHGTCNSVAVLGAFFLQVFDVDAASLIADQRDDFHAAHGSCCGVGAVG